MLSRTFFFHAVALYHGGVRKKRFVRIDSFLASLPSSVTSVLSVLSGNPGQLLLDIATSMILTWGIKTRLAALNLSSAWDGNVV